MKYVNEFGWTCENDLVQEEFNMATALKKEGFGMKKPFGDRRAVIHDYMWKNKKDLIKHFVRLLTVHYGWLFIISRDSYEPQGELKILWKEVEDVFFIHRSKIPWQWTRKNFHF